MLPYERHPDESTESMNKENFETWHMLTTPYKANILSSSTDNSKYELDTNDVSGWYRYAAYTALRDPDYTSLFSKESVKWMSAQISLRLEGVHPEGKYIVIPDQTILSVADSFYRNTQLTVEMLQEMVIMKIVEQVKLDFQVTIQNDKLSAWVQKYDMTTGLKQWSDVQSWINQKKRTNFYSWNY